MIPMIIILYAMFYFDIKLEMPFGKQMSITRYLGDVLFSFLESGKLRILSSSEYSKHFTCYSFHEHPYTNDFLKHALRHFSV